jgi:hypothetical protein
MLLERKSAEPVSSLAIEETAKEVFCEALELDPAGGPTA